jgi:hypothetical protein
MGNHEHNETNRKIGSQFNNFSPETGRKKIPLPTANCSQIINFSSSNFQRDSLSLHHCLMSFSSEPNRQKRMSQRNLGGLEK